MMFNESECFKMDTISILLVVIIITGSILCLILDDNVLPCLSTLIIVCGICLVFISINVSKIPVQASKQIDVATSAQSDSSDLTLSN